MAKGVEMSVMVDVLLGFIESAKVMKGSWTYPKEIIIDKKTYDDLQKEFMDKSNIWRESDELTKIRGIPITVLDTNERRFIELAMP